MDNVTHTLIGVLAGEALALSLPAARSGLTVDSRRNLLLSAMAVGSNLPDLDFLYGASTHNKLDYLLQHRGYTHTVVGAIGLALLTLAACALWIRIRKMQATRADYRVLFGVALLAPLLHIAMDFTNSYGVHPFWPFYDGWLYGDSVFIVEPLIWAAAAAPLVFGLRTLVARVLAALVLIAGIGLSLWTGLVPAAFVALLVLLTLVMLLVGRHATPRKAVLAGIAAWLAVTALFAAAGRVAAKEIEASARAEPGRLLDHVLTPLPANPVCWDVLVIQSDGDRYTLRQGMLSLAPAWMPAHSCPSRMQTIPTTAPLAAVKQGNAVALAWRTEVNLSAQELRRLAGQYCQAQAVLRFARAPFYTGRIVGDLRYDRERRAGFAEADLDKDRCPAFAAPWIPPRADLLRLQRNPR